MSLSTPQDRPVSGLGTVAELLEALGDIPPERVRLQPALGTATEADLLMANSQRRGRCELVDGVLVEKAMGYFGSMLAMVLIGHLEAFLKEHDLGSVAGESGASRLMPGLVRAPDVSFVSAGRLRAARVLSDRVPNLVPDFAVEVLSASNTTREMERKVREYFETGVRLVWLVDPDTQTVRVRTRLDEETTVGLDGTLDGGDVLPGFTLAVAEWFARASRWTSSP